MSFQKFKSTTGGRVQVALTSGHAVVVPPEGREIHSRFHRRAVELGCLPMGSEEHQEAKGIGEFNQDAVIEEGLRAMLESTDPKAFNADNTPNVNLLSKQVGFRVSKDQVLPVWDRVQASLDDGGEGGDGEGNGEGGGEGAGDDANGGQ